MFKIPTKLRIIGHVYRIKKEKLEQDGWCMFGLANHSEKTISLNTSNDHTQDEETMIHEVIHVLSERTGAGLNERQVTAISNGIYCVLKDNPRLLNT